MERYRACKQSAHDFRSNTMDDPLDLTQITCFAENDGDSFILMRVASQH